VAAVELALLGGPPAVTIPARPADVGRAELRALLRAIRRATAEPLLAGAVSGTGPVATLEEAFRACLGVRHALAVSSGTAALHLALLACGIGRGDEVVLSPYDWGAGVAAVQAVGARPVFADIDPKTYTLDPAAVRAVVSPRTKALLVTHIFGHPAPLAELLEVARRHRLALVEDCAQALGARYRGRPVGTFGDFGCFSLGPGKPVTAGEGGLLATEDSGLYRRAVRLSQHPLRQLREGLTPYPFGLNFRINPLGALAALAGLGRYPRLLARRRRLVGRLEKELAGVRGIRGVWVEAGCEHAYHRYSPTFVAEEWDGLPRRLVVEALSAEGVPVNEGFIEAPLYRRLPGYRGPACPATERRCREQMGLFLPEGLTEREFAGWARQVSAAVEKVHRQRKVLADLVGRGGFRGR
jgi:dTDP-4-amino-4,6-dideoxygalactose transaminase